MLRKPVVSGQFYPDDVEELKRFISGFSSKEERKTAAKGAILPHAGYIFSGKVAIATVAKILPKNRIIILGPNHTGLGDNFSLYPEGNWYTPFGEVAIDEEIALKIIESGEYITKDTGAHTFEHSIEVELPILQYFFNKFKFVPIVCQVASLDIYRKVAEQIYQAIKSFKEEVLIIASSDMSHYEAEEIARKKDRIAIEAIINLDEKELLKRVEKENISMCGVAPVAITIILTKLLGAKKAEVVLYTTSGEVTKDFTSVVGYLGAIIN